MNRQSETIREITFAEQDSLILVPPKMLEQVISCCQKGPTSRFALDEFYPPDLMKYLRQVPGEISSSPNTQRKHRRSAARAESSFTEIPGTKKAGSPVSWLLPCKAFFPACPSHIRPKTVPPVIRYRLSLPPLPAHLKHEYSCRHRGIQ